MPREFLFMIDGQEVRPTYWQRFGLLLITLGGRILKGAAPNKVEYRSTPPE